jgi:hypothetical protein
VRAGSHEPANLKIYRCHFYPSLLYEMPDFGRDAAAKEIPFNEYSDRELAFA